MKRDDFTIPMHSTEAEHSVLGALLLDNESISRVKDLQPEWFYGSFNADVFRAIQALASNGKPFDFVTVYEQLQAMGKAENGSELAELNAIAQYVPSAANMHRYAEILRDKHQSRGLAKAAAQIAELATAPGKPSEQLDAAQMILAKLAVVKNVREPQHINASLAQYLELLQDLSEGKNPALATGIGGLDRLLNGGLRRGEMMVIGARPKHGKAQPLDAKVLTSVGWATMGSLKVGDALASIDGLSSAVTGVFPQGRKQVYRVTFTDGRSAECCDEHLWRVHHRQWAQPKVLSTANIRALMDKPTMKGRLWIDSANGEFGSHAKLPLDPWLLGALLGDGDMTQATIRFSKTEEQILSLVRNALPEQVGMTYAGGCDWRLSKKDGKRGGTDSNPLTAAIRALGLAGCKSEEKFIPVMYMAADRYSRLCILRGLMDTDGWVEKDGSVKFQSSSLQLAKDVQTLARSLGYWCFMRSRETGYKKDGVFHPCLPAYCLAISGEGIDELFLFDGKRERVAGRVKFREVVFKSIEAVREAECQCISVSHESSLYVTDDYVVTHNTALALQMARNMARDYSVLFISQEMPVMQLMHRHTAAMGDCDLGRILRADESDAAMWTKVAEAANRLGQLNLIHDDQSAQSLLDIRRKAMQVKRQHGLDVLFVDFLQLMQGAGEDNRNRELDVISNGLKALAMDLQIAVVVLSQMSRKADETFHHPTMTYLRDSGAIEAAADQIALLFTDHAHPLSPKLDNFQGYSQLEIVAHRNGPTGTAPMRFIGQYQQMIDWEGQTPRRESTAHTKRGM